MYQINSYYNIAFYTPKPRTLSNSRYGVKSDQIWNGNVWGRGMFFTITGSATPYPKQAESELLNSRSLLTPVRFELQRPNLAR